MTEIDYILDATKLSLKDIITSVINSRFIIDYGTVLKNNGDGTVDVQHAVPIVPKYPDANPAANAIKPTVTHSVEVLYLASANFGSTFQLTAGDFVLLVGLKDYVPTTTQISPNPQAPAAFYHYSQNTIKAIPMAGTNSTSKGQINVVNGQLQLKYASVNPNGPNYVESDATTDSINWPLLTTLGAIFGLTITQLAGKLNTNEVDIK
jgi:hypothetical protein